MAVVNHPDAPYHDADGNDVWPEDVPLCVHCDHEEDEHDLWTGGECNDYTPTWPRLVRCPCPGFELDRIVSASPVSVDERAVADFLDEA